MTLFALVILLVIFLQTSPNNLTVASVHYSDVAPSPNASYEKKSGLIQEKQCFVAKLCEFKIHQENFSCKISEYVISQGQERILPRWLWFDKGNEILKGIPSPNDEGHSEILIIGLRKHHTSPTSYICGLLTIKFVVWGLKYFPLFAENFPASLDINDKFSKTLAWPRSVACQFNEPIILASLVFAGDLHELDAKQRVKVLDKLLQAYHISMHDVFLLSNGDPWSGLLHTSHVLASGPGANRSASGPRTTISWYVKCGAVPLDDSLFQVMETLSRNLISVDNISYAAVGWHVITGYQKRHVRRRRNVIGTTTPAYNTIPVSRVTVITKKIKTSYIRPTVTWSRPLPTFSSPLTASRTSWSTTVTVTSSRINETMLSQYKNASSTLAVMSQARVTSSTSQVSPSKLQSSQISQYKNFSSMFSMTLSSRTVSLISLVSPSERHSSGKTQYGNVSLILPTISKLGISSNLQQSSKISSSLSSTFPIVPQSKNVSSSKMSSQTQSLSVTIRLKNLSTISEGSFSKSSAPSYTNQEPTTATYTKEPSRTSVSSFLSSKIQATVYNTNQSSTLIYSSWPNISIIISKTSALGRKSRLFSTDKIPDLRSTAARTMAHSSNSTTGMLQPSYSYPLNNESSLSRTYSPMLYVTTSRNINATESKKSEDVHFKSLSSTEHATLVPTTALRSALVATYFSSLSHTPITLNESSVHQSNFMSSTSFLPRFSSFTGDEQHTMTSLNASRTSGSILLGTVSVSTQTSKINQTVGSTILVSTSETKSLQFSEYMMTGTMTVHVSSDASISSQRNLTSISKVKPTFSVESGSLLSTLDSKVIPSSITAPPLITGFISASSSFSQSKRSSLFSSPTLAASIGSSDLQSQASSLSSSYEIFGSSFSHVATNRSSLSSFYRTSSSTVVTTTLLSVLRPPYSTLEAVSSSITISPSSYLLPSYNTLSILSSAAVTSLSSPDFHSTYKTASSSISFVAITSLPYASSYNHTSLLPSYSMTITSTNLLSSYHSPIVLSSAVTSISLSDIPISYWTSATVTAAVAMTVSPSFNFSVVPSFALTTTPLNLVSSSHTSAVLSSSVTNISLPDSLSSHKTAFSPSSFVTITSLSNFSSSYHASAERPIVGTLTPSSDLLLSSYRTAFSVFTSSSSYLLKFTLPYHSPILTSTFLTTSSSHLMSSQQTFSVVAASTSSDLTPSYSTISLLSSSRTTAFSDILSPHYTPNLPSPATIILSSMFSSHYVLTEPFSNAASSSTNVLSFYYSRTVASTPVTSISLSDLSSPQYTGNESLSSATTISPLSNFSSPNYTFNVSSSVVTTTSSSDLLSSHDTITEPSSSIAFTSSTSPLFVTTTTPLPVLNASSSYSVIPVYSLASQTLVTFPGSPSSFSSASYETFSLSFFSSSTASNKPSISSDISTMARPTVESSVSYSLTKSSTYADATRLSQPSRTGVSRPHTTRIVVTRTLMNISVSKSTSELLPSPSSSEASSSTAIPPTRSSMGSPKIYNSFDLLRVTIGQVFNVQIPTDTFHDREDGNTRYLKLRCLTVTHGTLSSDSWLQFNATTQTLYGLVLKSQVDMIESEFLLTATDRDGNTVYDAFTVDIEDSMKPLAAMFSLRLTGYTLRLFNGDLSNVLSIVQTIAVYYGDKDESLIRVETLTAGSIIFTWSNTSLRTCNKDLINELARRIITKQGDIQPYFFNALSPRFKAKDVAVNYTDLCVLPTTENPSISKSASQQSLWLKYVLPFVVIAAIIVVVACLLLRRHSGVKVLKEDKKTFRRRKPIILDEERELSNLSGKPIELPEDSLTPLSRETFSKDNDDADFSPIPAPPYEKLPFKNDDTSLNYTPPPPYRLPPSY